MGDTTGIRETREALDRLKAAIEAATPKVVNDVMKQTARQQQTLLSLGAHRRGTPTGSVPPDPPWRISGQLRRSVIADPARETGAHRWQGQVGPSRLVPYGRIQELGGWAGRGHRTHLPARPSLKPAWRVVRVTATRTCAKGWQHATALALR